MKRTKVIRMKKKRISNNFRNKKIKLKKQHIKSTKRLTPRF